MAHKRILWAGLLLLVGGFALGTLAGAVWLAAVGWGLFGIGGVVLVSLMFLLVGESEDRDRLRNPHGQGVRDVARAAARGDSQGRLPAGERRAA